MSFFITIFRKIDFQKKIKIFSIAEGSIVGSKAPKGDIKMARYREVFYSLSPVVTSVSIVAPVGITVISTIVTSVIGFRTGFSFGFGISRSLSEVTVSVCMVGVSVVSRVSVVSVPSISGGFGISFGFGFGFRFGISGPLSEITVSVSVGVSVVSAPSVVSSVS